MGNLPKNHSPEAMEEFFQSGPDPFKYQTDDHVARAEQYTALVSRHTKFGLARRLLDVGCGEGYLTHVLSDAAEHTVGIDVSQTAIARAKVAYSDLDEMLEFRQVDFLQLRTRKFDCLVLTAVLPYFDSRWDQFMVTVDRLLKKGGLVVTSFVSEGCVTDPWISRLEGDLLERVDTVEFTCNGLKHRAHLLRKK